MHSFWPGKPSNTTSVFWPHQLNLVSMWTMCTFVILFTVLICQVSQSATLQSLFSPHSDGNRGRLTKARLPICASGFSDRHVCLRRVKYFTNSTVYCEQVLLLRADLSGLIYINYIKREVKTNIKQR